MTELSEWNDEIQCGICSLCGDLFDDSKGITSTCIVKSHLYCFDCTQMIDAKSGILQNLDDGMTYCPIISRHCPLCTPKLCI